MLPSPPIIYKLQHPLCNSFSTMYMIMFKTDYCHYSNVQVTTKLKTSLHKYEDPRPFEPLSHVLHHSAVSCSSQTTSSAAPSWAIPYVNSYTCMSRDSPHFLKSGKNINKMKLRCLCTDVNESL